jgi:hypothetical protein
MDDVIGGEVKHDSKPGKRIPHLAGLAKNISELAVLVADKEFIAEWKARNHRGFSGPEAVKMGNKWRDSTARHQYASQVVELSALEVVAAQVIDVHPSKWKGPERLRGYPLMVRYLLSRLKKLSRSRGRPKNLGDFMDGGGIVPRALRATSLEKTEKKLGSRELKNTLLPKIEEERLRLYAKMQGFRSLADLQKHRDQYKQHGIEEEIRKEIRTARVIESLMKQAAVPLRHKPALKQAHYRLKRRAQHSR